MKTGEAGLKGALGPIQKTLSWPLSHPITAGLSPNGGFDAKLEQGDEMDHVEF